jgi:DNA-binding transcriptional regulator YhcF (GntR family)
MNAGWIMLHRKLLDNPLARRPAYCHLWVHLLLRACHREVSFIWNERRQRLAPGQLLTGRKQLSQETGIPEGTVEKILRYLETEQQIEQQTTARFRVITIRNWGLYQSTPAVEQQNDNSTTAEEPRSDTYNKDKNEHNEKESTHAAACRLAGVLLKAIQERKPDLRMPNLQRWIPQMAGMLDVDKRTPERVEAVIRWCQSDPFWSTNILNPASLRRHFDRLELAMRGSAGAHRETVREMVARMEREGTL